MTPIHVARLSEATQRYLRIQKKSRSKLLVFENTLVLRDRHSNQRANSHHTKLLHGLLTQPTMLGSAEILGKVYVDSEVGKSRRAG